MSVVVVTGPAGHVGANLARALLARGQRVRALVHKDMRGLEGLKLEIVTGDLADVDSLRRAFDGADLVYHTAAYISLSMYQWKWLETINVLGTRNVVDACLQCGVRRLVHFSSIEALVDGPGDKPVDESRPLVESRRHSPYARSKAAAEKEIRRGLARGLDSVTLNPAAIIGPHDYRLGFANAGLLAICRGSLLALVEGGFNWVDVRDVVAGALQAADRASSGGQYILAGHWASLRELAGLAEEVYGARVPRFDVPMWLARLGAPFATAWSSVVGGRALYTTASLKPLCGYRRISHDRAARELDYQPRPLQESFADTVQWFETTGVLEPRRPSSVSNERREG